MKEMSKEEAGGMDKGISKENYINMDLNINMEGKTVVITGFTSGIGLATAKLLAGYGAYIIGTGRNESRCQQAESIIKSAFPESAVSYLVADLSSLKQVRELAGNIKKLAEEKNGGSIDVLINNAGTFSSWYVSTPEGFELQFAVNHLAPFLLTHELLPLLQKAPAGRIITVSSGSHYRTRIHWKDIMLRKHYNCLLAYKQSKLANVLFTVELNRRLGRDSKVRAFAVDPGLVNTDIGLKGTTGIARWIWKKRSKNGVPPERAARSIAFLAGEPSIQDRTEVYWKDCKPVRPSRYSQKPEAAIRLWELSEKMCGIRR